MKAEEVYKMIKASAALYAQECATKNITPNTETAYVAGAYWAIRNINLLK